jgi:hypothetical protein
VGHSVWHPVTNHTVRGVHPHGTCIVDVDMHVGTGQRIGAQSAGRVVLVTRGQVITVVDEEVVVVRVGRTMMLVTMPVG